LFFSRLSAFLFFLLYIEFRFSKQNVAGKTHQTIIFLFIK
jgi:hypothetical protein